MLIWILQAAISNIPGWIWPSLIVFGVLLHFFYSFIPTFTPMAPFLKLIGSILIIISSFMLGSLSISDFYQSQINEMKQKVKIAEEKSQELDKKLEEKTKEKNKIVHDVQIVYKTRIKEITKIIDAKCKFDPEASKILNDAAVNPIKDIK